MDDNNSPIGLDINPDMMTTQTGSPQAPFSDLPVSTPPVASPPVTPPVVEDITPKDSSSEVAPDVLDITPGATPPAGDTATHLIDVVPHTPEDLIEKPAPVVPPAVTPPAPAPIETIFSLPEPTPATPPAVTPPIPAPAETTPTAPAVTAPVRVELPPVMPQNPLSENPDTVTLK